MQAIKKLLTYPKEKPVVVKNKTLGFKAKEEIIPLEKPKIVSLNLASNMISGEGVESILDDLISNTSLKALDLGVYESS